MAHYLMEWTASRKRARSVETTHENATRSRASKLPRKRADSIETTINFHIASHDSEYPPLEASSSVASASFPSSSKTIEVKDMGPEAVVFQNFSTLAAVHELLKRNNEDAVAFEEGLIGAIRRGKYKNFVDLMKDNGPMIKTIRMLLLGQKKSEDDLCLWKSFDSFLVQAVESEGYGAGVLQFENYVDPDENFFDVDEEKDCLERIARLKVGNKYYTPLSPPTTPRF